MPLILTQDTREEEEMSDEMLEGPLLITAADVARLLQVSTRTLWRLRSTGRLPQDVRLGGTVRWRLDEVRKWIANGCQISSDRK
jgi:excisionase family DNA binding protein